MRRLPNAGWSLAALLVLALALIVVVWPWVHTGFSASRTPAADAQTSIPPPHVRIAYQRNPHLPDPRHRMFLGTFTSLRGVANPQLAAAQREAAMGRRYDLEATFYNWLDVFPEHGEAAMAAAGVTPLVTWYGPKIGHPHAFVLGQVNSGAYDALILRQAEAIKAFHKLIWLQPMIEMNGNWYRGYSGHPRAFIKAWRHIHDLFRQARVHNVLWVWVPNITPGNWDQYYPGNSYVDIIGVDGYNNLAWGPWRSFAQIFNPFFIHFAGRKPLLVGETATAAGPAAGPAGAASWISDMRLYLKDVAGPRYGVVAVCWFDTDTSSGRFNWRVDQTPAAWQAWLTLARDPYFGGRPAGAS